MGRIAIYKTLPTVTKSGVSNIAHLVGKKGVYHIYENSTRVYVGSSITDLYKTIIRHFQQWEDSNQEKRISYKDKLGKFSYTVQIELMDGKTSVEIETKEYQSIAKYQPRDNKLRKYCDFMGECKTKVQKAKEALKVIKKNAAIKKAQPKRAAAKKTAKKTVTKKRAPKKKIIDDVPF